eukprot:ctg_735.g361
MPSKRETADSASARGETEQLAQALERDAPLRETVVTRHANWVQTLAFSPTGRSLLTGSNDGSVRVSEPESGVTKLEIRGDVGLRVRHRHGDRGERTDASVGASASGAEFPRRQCGPVSGDRPRRQDALLRIGGARYSDPRYGVRERAGPAGRARGLRVHPGGVAGRRTAGVGLGRRDGARVESGGRHVLARAHRAHRLGVGRRLSPARWHAGVGFQRPHGVHLERQDGRDVAQGGGARTRLQSAVCPDHWAVPPVRHQTQQAGRVFAVAFAKAETAFAAGSEDGTVVLYTPAGRGEAAAAAAMPATGVATAPTTEAGTEAAAAKETKHRGGGFCGGLCACFGSSSNT